MHVPDPDDGRPTPYQMPTELQRAQRALGVELARRDLPRWVRRNAYSDLLQRDGWSEDEADRIAWEHFVPGIPWPAVG